MVIQDLLRKVLTVHEIFESIDLVRNAFQQQVSMRQVCGCGSVVERHLAKVNVARSNRVTRLINRLALRTYLYIEIRP